MPADTLVLTSGGRRPEFGVFCGWAALVNEEENGGEADAAGAKPIEQPYQSVLSWGVNPQFGLDKPLFEVHMMGLEWEGDLYNRKLVCLATHRLRDECSFPGGLDELRRAIELDMATAKRLLSDRTPSEAADLLTKRVAACYGEL